MTTNVELTGYLESAQWLQPGTELSWNQRELLDAARRAELRNTGWPVGVVMDTRSERPNPTAEGIEVKIGDFENGKYDYWILRTDGTSSLTFISGMQAEVANAFAKLMAEERD